ncbi:MAG: UMP kinase [Roseivirga sp.]
MQYKKILLKLSGEALMGPHGSGIDASQLALYADEIAKVQSLGVSLAVVIGGGNIYRGARAALDIPRVKGDFMGMLATAINGLALQSALEKRGIPTRVMSSLSIESVCESYVPHKAMRHLEKKRLVIIVGGLGVPYFTTDSAASLRAIELEVDVLLKGTQVDGVYSDDPHKNPAAVRLDQLSFQEAFQRKLAVMDVTAFTLCEENNLPIIVYNAHQPDDLLRIVQGERLGTLIANSPYVSPA